MADGNGQTHTVGREGGDSVTRTPPPPKVHPIEGRLRFLRGYGTEAQSLRCKRTGNGATADEVAAVLGGVDDELWRILWDRGWLTLEPLRATALFCEESGEALQAALDLTRTSIERTAAKDLSDLVHLCREMEQAMALGVLHLINIRRAIDKRYTEAKGDTTSAE